MRAEAVSSTDTSSTLPSRKSVTIRAALIEAITRKLEYIEWTPQELQGRVEVSLDEQGARTYWLDKAAILKVSRRTLTWLVPPI
jgi:hypothetical protein